MRISPLDIYHKEFKKSTFGYNVNEVNNFLDEVGMAYEKLLKEVNSIQDKNERLKERIKNYEDMEEKMEKMLVTIQEASREQANQARKEGEIIIQKAELKAERIIKETKQKLQEEYKALQELKESKELFKIRFKTLLNGYLQMYENDQEREVYLEAEEDVAVGKIDFEEQNT